ncbi:uncharacterized protein FYW61_013241 [Anableps anableps]
MQKASSLSCRASLCRAAPRRARTNQATIAGVIDLGTVETFSVFQAARRGLIDQDTCRVLLEAQLVMGGLVRPDSSEVFSLDHGLTEGLIDAHTCQSLAELESALELIRESVGDQKLLPIATAMESGLIKEEVGLRILELQMNSGGLRDSCGKIMSLEQAEDMRVLSPRILNKLYSRVQHKELIDPNTAEKVSIEELKLHCIPDDDSGLLLLPVKQQPGGTVCLRSGRKVGIFRAVQEGLIDRAVTVRLLEAQLFAGGISDPRSGHRLTIGEAVRHGLMDQDLACAMLARQLQNGGILDPLSGERLDLEESIRRDLLSPRLALLVLESLWTFTGLLWPASGELMPIAEALQQGVISGDLARNILRQRHAVGGLYSPETLKVLPLNQAAEVDLEPDVVRCLRDIHIPDVLYNMNQSGIPSLNRLSWGSTSSSPLPLSSPTAFMWEALPADRVDPEIQAKDKLLFHLMTHSYVDAHSGKRLVLLDQELVLMVKATGLAAGESIEAESPNRLAADKPQKLGSGGSVNISDEAEEHSSDLESSGGNLEMMDASDGGKDIKVQQKLPETAGRDSISEPKPFVDAKVRKEMEEMSSLQNKMFSGKHQEEREVIKCQDKVVGETIPQCLEVKDKIPKISFELAEGIKSDAQQEQKSKVKDSKDLNLREAQEFKDTKVSPTDLTSVSETDGDVKQSETAVDEPLMDESQEDAELKRLVLELKQGGLMTEEGEKLLPDEAVAQGVLPGHTAVKLMAQAGLFGGFLDATSGESLSLEEVMQEGLLDEDLMWGILKSDKTIAGVVDVEKHQLLGVRDAAQAGLIDPNTAARLLEAQVVSGGIVDLRRDKKVSVTLAANMGLIEEGQREELIALEKAFKGKDTDPATSLRKASLQLQMEGVVDPESRSAVPLDQAIKKGLIGSDEAYQVLARQVAEGGIIHHASGMRLTVSDAVDRGLVDRSIATGLEELEWIYQGKVSVSSNPEAIAFQATTGAVLDPDNGARLTLTEAVSKGLLAENVASEVMASPMVTHGMIDPKTAWIVPYSELVSQGKIDIETGKRFLEVKPFRGVQDKQTLETLTLPEAVALKRVDPVPALRLLQSQADTGGIIDIRTGERLPLREASSRGLIGGDMVKEIATNQLVKGGLVDPATGQRVSDLSDAIASRLLTRDLALEIQEALKESFPGDRFTPIVVTGPSPDSPTNMYPANIKTSSGYPSSVSSSEVTQDYDEALRCEISDQALLRPEDEVVAEPESEQSMDLLSKFTSNVEKRIQQAIQEIIPQKVTSKLDKHLQQEPGDRMENNGEQRENLTRDSGKESTQVLIDHKEESQKEVQKEDSQEPEKDQDMEFGPIDESTVTVHRGSEDVKLAEIRVNRESKVGLPAGNEELLETKTSTGVEQSGQFSSSTSKESDNKSKKKKRSKKKAKGKEVETETHLPEIKHESQTYQTSPETTEIPQVASVDTEITFDQNVQKSDSYLSAAADPSSAEGMERTDVKPDTKKVLVEQEQEEVVYHQPSSQLEEDAPEMTLAGKKGDMKREEESVKETLTAKQNDEPEVKHPSGTDGKPPERPQVAPVDTDQITSDEALQKSDSYELPATTYPHSGESMGRSEGKVETKKALVEQEQKEVVSPQSSSQMEEGAAQMMSVDKMEGVKREEEEDGQSMKVLIAKRTEEPERTHPSQDAHTSPETPQVPQVAPVDTDQITSDEDLQKSDSYDLLATTDPHSGERMGRSEEKVKTQKVLVEQEQEDISLEPNTEVEEDAARTKLGRTPGKIAMEEEESRRVLSAKQIQEPEKESPSQIDAQTPEEPQVAPVDTEENTFDEDLQKPDSDDLPADSHLHSGESMRRTEEKVETEKVLAEHEQEEVSLEPTTEMEEDAAKATLLKTPQKVCKQEEVKRESMEKAKQPEEPERTQEPQKTEKAESLKKSTLKEDEKAALILKAKESILKKVFEKGVSEKQAAQELEALKKKKQSKAGDKKTENNSGEGDAEKRSSDLLEDRNDQLTVEKDPVELEKTPGVQEKLGGKPTETSSSETLRAKQTDAETLPSVSRSKRTKRSKKPRSLKPTEDQPEVEKVTSDLKDLKYTTKSPAEPELDGTVLTKDTKSSIDTDDQSVGAATKKPKSLKPTEDQPEEEKATSHLKDTKSTAEPESDGTALTEDVKLSTDDEATKKPKSLKPTEEQPELEKVASEGEIGSDLKDMKITSKSGAKQQPESRFLSENLKVSVDTDYQSFVEAARPSDVGKVNQKDPEGAKSLQKTQIEQAAEGSHSDPSDLTDLAQEVSSKLDRELSAQSVALDPHSGKRKRKENLQPLETESSHVPESLTNLQQHLDSPETAVLSKEDASVESESPKVTTADQSTESLEDEAKVAKNQKTMLNKEEATSTGRKSSILRQECLEHDQRIIALLSKVRHVEVQLKQQQQQQSVGRSLVTLDSIISRTETLDLELSDLEPEISKEVEAADRLLNPRPTDVPPQLLLALEKDGRSLARAYEAARALSEGILQSLRRHRDSCKVAVTAEQKSLGQHVDRLLSWLSETEAQMDRETTGKEDGQAGLTQQLDLCKELQSSLSTRSGEVSSLVSDIQLFISERAQDLTPEQSRQLLEQLQQLQTAFHRASGRAEAWADALSAQRGREEEERRRRERLREEEEEDRERRSAREREVWKEMNGILVLLCKLPPCFHLPLTLIMLSDFIFYPLTSI